MIQRIFAFLVFLLLLQPLSAQNDSIATLKISLLTCAPGTEVYSLFGHSAIRVQNSRTGKDVVYNYGMFSFGQPNFLPKFIQGKLNYWVGRSSMKNFMREYQHDKRAVFENEILLTPSEALEMQAFLINNLKKENRYYQYDFFFDNCSSRIRDVLENLLGNQLQWKSISEDALPSYRDQIDLYLGDYPWTDFGIDLILGKPTDDPTDFRMQMFLPDFLMQNMQAGIVTRAGQTKPLLGPTERIIDFPSVLPAIPFWKKPMFLFCLLLALILAGSWYYPTAKFWNVIDFLIFFITGIAGSLFVFMWLGTDHQACYQNWNMLWLFPLNIFGAFFIFRKNKLSVQYFKLYTAMVVIALLGWFLWPQQFHLAFLPFMLIILTRLIYRFFIQKQPTKIVAL